MEDLVQNFTCFSQSGRNWVWLDDLHKLLKEDTAESTKPSKVERTFNGYKQQDRIHIIQEKKAVPLKSLLKFIFSKTDISQPCSSLAQSIEQHVLRLPGKKKQCGIINL